jgi:hypothetical protein
MINLSTIPTNTSGGSQKSRNPLFTHPHAYNKNKKTLENQFSAIGKETFLKITD